MRNQCEEPSRLRRTRLRPFCFFEDVKILIHGCALACGGWDRQAFQHLVDQLWVPPRLLGEEVGGKK